MTHSADAHARTVTPRQSGPPDSPAAVQLSIVVPAYNEEARLGRTLHRVCTVMDGSGICFEVIVVDDGSDDNTAGIARAFAEVFPQIRIVRLSENRGKGNAVRHGLLEARGDYVLMSDADLSTPIEELFRRMPHVEDGYDVVIGSRKMRGAKVVVPQSEHRRFMGKVFSLLSQMLLVPGIHDFTCGFKLFKREVAHDLARSQRLHDWSFDTEILYLAHRRDHRVKEVPVTWVNSPDTKVRLLRDTFGSFLGLLRIRLNELLGRYRRSR
jgi:dolichyl-phosphate beta-glucosyltransferase